MGWAYRPSGGRPSEHDQDLVLRVFDPPGRVHVTPTSMTTGGQVKETMGPGA